MEEQGVGGPSPDQTFEDPGTVPEAAVVSESEAMKSARGGGYESRTRIKKNRAGGDPRLSEAATERTAEVVPELTDGVEREASERSKEGEMVGQRGENAENGGKTPPSAAAEPGVAKAASADASSCPDGEVGEDAAPRPEQPPQGGESREAVTESPAPRKPGREPLDEGADEGADADGDEGADADEKDGPLGRAQTPPPDDGPSGAAAKTAAPASAEAATEAGGGGREAAESAGEAEGVADAPQGPGRAPQGPGEASEGCGDGGGDGGEPAASPAGAEGGSGPVAEPDVPPAATGADTTDAESEVASAKSVATEREEAGKNEAAEPDEPRPSGKPVDQPTTALRLPSKSGTPTEGGTPSSTFVPLKKDIPAAPSAPPPWPTPEVPPVPAAPPPLPDSERPPLELLAALTNKQAPPPTPLRSVLRRIKIWTPLVVLLAIVFCLVQSLRPLPSPSLEITTEETFTFGGEVPTVPWPEHGQAVLDVAGLGTFGTSGDPDPVPIASIAKVMTAYIVLRDHPVEDGSDGAEIPVDQLAEEEAYLSEQGESTVEVQEGDNLTQREAIQAIMIASANNVARLLARWDAGSEEAFVDKMNDAAEELGMVNTTYTDPSGLKSDTVSTAADQVLLGQAAMEDPLFREIVRQPSYEDRYGAHQGNWNHLVPLNRVVGIKTGTTSAAGGNLLFAAEQEVADTTQLIVGAVLGQPPHPSDNSILTGALTAGDQLMTFAQQELLSEQILSEGDVVGHVDDGLGGQTPVVLTEDVEAIGWPGLKVRLELRDGEDGVPGSAAADTEVGRLVIGAGSGQVEAPVALRQQLSEPGFWPRLTRLG